MVQTFRDSSVSCSSNVRLFTSWLPNKKRDFFILVFFWMGGQLVNYATSSQFHGKKQYKKCYLLQITINKVVKIEIKWYFTLAGRTSTCLRICSILLLKTQNNFKSIVKQNHKNSVIVTIASYLKWAFYIYH